MSDLTNQLQKLKDKIDNAKIEMNKAEGRLSELMKQLKTEFGCGDLKSAEAKMLSFEKDIAKLEKKIEDGINELKEITDEFSNS